MRLECSLLAASFYKSLLTYSLPHPVRDLDYVSYHLPQSTSGTQLTPGLEVFSDVHRCSPQAVLTSLHWTAQELIQRHHSVKVCTTNWFGYMVGHLDNLTPRPLSVIVVAQLHCSKQLFIVRATDNSWRGLGTMRLYPDGLLYMYMYIRASTCTCTSGIPIMKLAWLGINVEQCAIW